MDRRTPQSSHGAGAGTSHDAHSDRPEPPFIVHKPASLAKLDFTRRPFGRCGLLPTAHPDARADHHRHGE